MACIDEGKITCWDNSCADTYAQCPELSSEWGSEDYTVQQYDNPWLQDEGISNDVYIPGDEGNLISYVYEEMGGESSLNMTLDEFTEGYSSYFHEYDPTQAQNIMQQLGLLDASMENRLSGFDLTQEGLELKDESNAFQLSKEIESTSNELYLAAAALEGVRRRGGGLRPGKSETTISQAFGSITDDLEMKKQGIELERDGIKLGMEQLAVDVEDYLYGAEGTQLNLIQDINKLESNYMDSLLDTMGTVQELISAESDNDDTDTDNDDDDDVVAGVTGEEDIFCDNPSNAWTLMCGGDGVSPLEENVNVIVDENGIPIVSETDDNVTLNDLTGEEALDLIQECQEANGYIVNGECANRELVDGEWVDYNMPPDETCSAITDGNCYSYDVETQSFVLQGPAALYMQFGSLAYDMYNQFQNNPSECEDLTCHVEEICQGAANQVGNGELGQGALLTGACAAGVVVNGIWTMVGGIGALWDSLGASGLELISSWIDGSGPSYNISDYDSYEAYCQAVPSAYLCMQGQSDNVLPGDDTTTGNWLCDNNDPCCPTDPAYDPCLCGGECPENEENCVNGGGTYLFIEPVQSGASIGSSDDTCSSNTGGGSLGGDNPFNSDEALKEDIKFLYTSRAGYRVYSFKYKDAIHSPDGDNTKTYKGVMAQEIEKIIPEATSRDNNGFLLVNYKMLDVNFEEFNAEE